ncbi:MAG TPA: PxKF domain-containing protein [Anaerolineales bacterium]|nr:PxKF domain-containing protein [Anaerolineales bacterium]
MKQKFTIAVALAVVLAMLLTSLVLADATPTIASDLPDYGPGDTVHLFGAGWLAGESVHIFVNDNMGSTWSRNADVVAAADGTLTDTFQLPNWFVATYSVTATGATSGTATTTFTDGSLQFVETGLPLGTSWSITWNGNTLSSTTNTVTFGGQAAGPFSYTVGSVTGYAASPASGSASRPQNGNTQVDITFTVSDNTAPVITPNVVGTLGSNGWYTSDVTVSWLVNDDQSAISSTSGCDPTTISSDTAGATVTCTATSAGGTSSESVTIKRDATAPTGVSGAPNRVPDSGTWYNHAVGVVFTGSDAPSGIASCTTTNYSGPDGSGVTVNGSCTDNAGNASASVASSTFNYDGTAPTAVLAVAAGTAGANGWYTSDVTVSTTGSDAVSGATCTTNQFQTTETAGAVFNGSCTNGAGLTTNAAPLTVKLDKSGPSASLAVTAGTPGANGWYTSDVTVSTSGSDSISSPVTCTADQFQNAETTGTDFNGSCTNDAGLTTNAAPLTVKLDTTGPSASLSAVGTLGNNGWYVSDVTIKTTGSDTISNPTACSSDQSQTTDATGATFNGSCTNDAGLSTNAAPLTVKRDATAPSITWYDVQNFYFGFPPATAPSCQASDVTSGPFDCVVTGYDPSALVGAHNLAATAHDVAGNQATSNNSYTVLGWTFKGFYQPVDMNGVFNVSKSGSTIPFKFEIFAGSTELTDVTYVKSFKYGSVACSATAPNDSIETVATGGTSLRYDTVAGQFVYNWKTPTTPGCYSVTMTTQDGSTLTAFFKLK